MLDGLGYFFRSENDGLRIMEKSKMVMKNVKKNDLYMLEGSSIHVSVVIPIISQVDRNKLWHLKLGHMSFKGMQEVSKQGLLCGDKIHELEFNENYIFGNAHKSKFTKGIHVAK